MIIVITSTRRSIKITQIIIMAIIMSISITAITIITILINITIMVNAVVIIKMERSLSERQYPRIKTYTWRAWNQMKTLKQKANPQECSKI